MEKAKLDNIVAEHPTAQLLELEDGTEIVIKIPSRGAYKRFRAKLFNEKQRHEAFEDLIVDCIVHPSTADWGKMLDARPGLCESFGPKIAEILGVGLEVSAKKALASLRLVRSG